MARNITSKSVQMHGVQHLDDNNDLCAESGLPCVAVEYCDPSDRDPDGWGVYLRVNFDAPDEYGQPFDITHENDFKTRAEAEAFADKLAEEHDCDVEIY